MRSFRNENQFRSRNFKPNSSMGGFLTKNGTCNTNPISWVGIWTDPVDLGCNPTNQEISDALSVNAVSATSTCGVNGGAVTIEGASEITITSNGCNSTAVRIFKATDGCGNTSSWVGYATFVESTEGPVITITAEPSDGQLGCNPSAQTISDALGTAVAFDECVCNEYAVNFTDGPVLEDNCYRSQTRTWTATNSCGIVSIATRTVYWKDNSTAPVITCPVSSNEYVVVDKVVECGGDVIFDDPEVSDTCGNVDLTYVDSVTEVHTRTWLATDECGNTSTCKQVIYVAPCEYEGCSTGYWKNHPEIWDETSDVIASMAGFTTTINFYTYFGISPVTGIPASTTMHDAVALGGGQCKGLARQGVSALLNAARYSSSFLYPAGANSVATLKTLIANALSSGNNGTCNSLSSELAISNTSGICEDAPNSNSPSPSPGSPGNNGNGKNKTKNTRRFRQTYYN